MIGRARPRPRLANWIAPLLGAAYGVLDWGILDRLQSPPAAWHLLDEFVDLVLPVAFGLWPWTPASGCCAGRPGSLQHCVDRGLAQLGLTEREATIARYLLKGLSNSEIAHAAGLSEKTVKQHLGQIFHKARVGSRTEFFSHIFPV